MLLVYNIFLTLSFIFLIPVFIYKLFTHKKYQSGYKERLGFISPQKLKRLSKKCVWFHAVSVGEASAVYPLYLSFKEKHSDIQVVFSTTTKTGQEWIQSRLRSEDLAIYFPLDLFIIVSSVLSKINPILIVIVETEIWPNFWWRAQQRHIPMALINARLSDHSYKGYSKFSFFISAILQKLSLLIAQTQQDADRFKGLGMKKDLLHVGGNLKFEAAIPSHEQYESAEQLKRKFQLHSEVFIIGGSTHDGEEEILLSCYQRLKNKFPDLRLILAPRHPERAETVEKLIQSHGLECHRDSLDSEQALGSDTVLLIDRMGRLPLYYALATVVFIGKSLTAHGGQNLLEPAAFGKVVMFGPNMQNFRKIAKLFVEKHAAVQVRNENDLEKSMLSFLESESRRRAYESKAKAIVENNKGALKFHLDQIEKLVSWHPSK